MSAAGNRSSFMVIGAAIGVPILAWWGAVSPVREAAASLHTESQALIAERDELLAKQAGHRGAESDRIRAVREVRRELESLPSSVAGASDVFRRLENTAAQAGVRIVRIEPGAVTDPESVTGPLELRIVETGRRSYRLDYECPSESLPYFVELVQQTEGVVEFKEIRVQTAPGSNDKVTGTLVFEHVTVRSSVGPKNDGGES